PRAAGRRRRVVAVVEVLDGPAAVARALRGKTFRVAAAGFWQVHPAALETLAAAVLDAVEPRAGDTVVELYAGAGALSAVLADTVGSGGRVLGLEGDRQAVADAAANLAAWPWARVQHGRVDAAAIAALDVAADIVVLDPPRAGAGRAVITAVAALRPRAIGYVSCDPATLARDVAALRALGWRLRALRAFDAFPMTHHVECLATLVPLRSAS
ncbi:MAG TPA: hypothetical protein VFU35_10065, partial [Jatrophihabitans sp.]|nr:hypothetical protein [Jatrophihabitans sp.]